MKVCRAVFISVAVLLFVVFGLLIVRATYPRPYPDEVKKSGLAPALVYAVIKAESSFREDAVSRAGAVGLMQIRPATAEFICAKKGIAFDASRLKEGEYNISVGCMYLEYLMGRFTVLETALAAYNAGEGKVCEWLKNKAYSADGTVLQQIPYPETAAYIKKVAKFRKNYEIFYGKT